MNLMVVVVGGHQVGQALKDEQNFNRKGREGVPAWYSPGKRSASAQGTRSTCPQHIGGVWLGRVHLPYHLGGGHFTTLWS